MLERSNTFDCLRTEPRTAQKSLRKTQSEMECARTDVPVSIFVRPASTTVLLWKKPAQNQATQQFPKELDESEESKERSPTEDIKHRWRRQQIESQQKKLAALEKTSFWNMRRKRGCLSIAMAYPLRSKSTQLPMGTCSWFCLNRTRCRICRSFAGLRTKILSMIVCRSG